MKNRQLNKLLGPAVILIWIMVIWQFFVNGDEQASQSDSTQQAYILPTDTQVADTFALLQPYRDPFLDKLPQVAPVSRPKPRRTSSRIGKLVKKPPKKVIRIPKMVYQGGVKRQEGDPMTGILQVEKRIYTIRKGDSLAGLHILDIQMNQLQVAIGDTSFLVYR